MSERCGIFNNSELLWFIILFLLLFFCNCGCGPVSPIVDNKC
ncbi:MAG: hypothetical protein N3B21_13955 [Clostridia bacterium]|nr:hypothetical protein [Clostridia bacterium]